MNIYYQRPDKDADVWESGYLHIFDDSKGYIKQKIERYAYKLDPNGIFRTLYDQPAKKVKRWSKKDEEAGLIFEGDVSPEMRYIIDTYTEDDTPSEAHRELIYDIEVDTSTGLPNLEKANNPITAISYYTKQNQVYIALLLDPKQEMENTDGVNENNERIVVKRFDTEEELLSQFVDDYTEFNPTILSGWNIDEFDNQYLYRRIKRILGDGAADALSPIGIVEWNGRRGRYFFAGVASLDYMQLYKKFTFGERISYSLDSIGKREINMGKYVYEGTLDKLYKTDKKGFLEYNVHDVRIVVGIDNKMKLIDLAKGIVHKGHCVLEDFFFSSRFLDGAMLTYMKRKGLVAPNRPARDEEHPVGEVGFEGAYVQEPVPGKYEWVVDLDATSLYPSIIMSLNISPETKVAKISNWNNLEFVQKKETQYNIDLGEKNASMNRIELDDFLTKQQFCVASNGLIYDQSKEGIIPEILKKWFDERTEYKNLMKKYGKEGDKVKYQFYFNRQWIQKIILNSLYGVLGLPSFRFYDLDNAAAVTTTGVDLIKFSQKFVNKFFQNELGAEHTDNVIYTDTDSLFFSVKELVLNRHPETDFNDLESTSKSILEVTHDIQKFVNDAMTPFANRFLHSPTHVFTFKQEIIAKSAFWTSKKRYALDVINKEGMSVSELEIKGLDVVRTNFPIVFRNFMKQMLKDILNDVPKDTIDNNIREFKKTLKTCPVNEIARPTGVKEISKWEDTKSQPFVDMAKGVPAHVKAAINYNDYLRYKKITNDYATIKDGEKVKWVYMKENPFKLAEMAFRDNGEDPQEILDFVSEYIDRDKIYEKEVVKKFEDFYNALKWGNIPTNVNKSKFF